MNEMYKRIQDLCKEQGINVTQMCKLAGVARAPLTELKMGRTAILSAKNADKIANYFDVSVGYLLGTEENKKPATENGSELSAKDKEIIERVLRLSDSQKAALEVLLRGIEGR